MIKILNNQSGQMFVETAVVLPIVLVIALIVINLFKFANLCAKFDRISVEQTIMCGSSYSQADSSDASEYIAQRIKSALQDDNCDIDVVLEAKDGEMGNLVSVFQKYTATLKYKPWPHVIRLPLVSFDTPLYLVHTSSIVVSPYKSGVVI